MGFLSPFPQGTTVCPMSRPHLPRPTSAAIGLALLVAGLCVAYALLSVLRFRRFMTPSWDNAIFAQAVSGYAHLHAPIVPIKGPGFNILGDHFSPALIVLAPVYRLLPDAETLLIAQVLLIGWSVWLLGRHAVATLGAAAGLAVAAAFGLSFGFQAAVKADFHEVALALPLLTAAGLAYLRDDPTRVVVWTVPLLLVKEDMGATVAAIGLALVLAGHRRHGTGLIVSGLLALGLVMGVIVPALNPAGTYAYAGSLGGGGSVFAVLVNAWQTKVFTVLVTVGISGFLALRSPWVVAIVPTLAWRFLADNAFYWGTDWHYSMMLMPIVFVAMLDGISRVRSAGPVWLRSYPNHVPAVAAAIAVTMVPTLPLGDLTKPELYAESPAERAGTQVLGRIPRGASVESDLWLLTHLTADHPTYWVGTEGNPAPDYIAVSVYGGAGAMALARDRHPGATYALMYDEGGYQVVRRTG